MTHNRKPRFIEPTIIPEWALIMYSLESVQDRYFSELMQQQPNEDKLDWLESEMKAKERQLNYQNYKFN